MFLLAWLSQPVSQTLPTHGEKVPCGRVCYTLPLIIDSDVFQIRIIREFSSGKIVKQFIMADGVASKNNSSKKCEILIWFLGLCMQQQPVKYKYKSSERIPYLPWQLDVVSSNVASILLVFICIFISPISKPQR